MEYIIEDEFEIELDIVTKPKPTADVELELPVIAIEERKPIYRGKIVKGNVSYVEYEVPAFELVGDAYRMTTDYRVTDWESNTYVINGVEYLPDRAQGTQYGVVFYYSKDGNEINVGQSTITQDPCVINVPATLGEPTTLKVGTVVPFEDGSAILINGKAPGGSSEDDPVWTVVWNYLDILGDITSKTTETNKIWSEI